LGVTPRRGERTSFQREFFGCMRTGKRWSRCRAKSPTAACERRQTGSVSSGPWRCGRYRPCSARVTESASRRLLQRGHAAPEPTVGHVDGTSSPLSVRVWEDERLVGSPIEFRASAVGDMTRVIGWNCGLRGAGNGHRRRQKKGGKNVMAHEISQRRAFNRREWILGKVEIVNLGR